MSACEKCFQYHHVVYVATQLSDSCLSKSIQKFKLIQKLIKVTSQNFNDDFDQSVNDKPHGTFANHFLGEEGWTYTEKGTQ